MEKTKMMNNIIITTLLVAVLFLSVGFAYFSQNLTVTGTVTTKAADSSWNVRITSLSASNTKGYATAAPTTSTVGSTGAVSVEFSCVFSAPGDQCTVNGEISNLGSLTAYYQGYEKTVKVGDTDSDLLNVTVTPGITEKAGIKKDDAASKFSIVVDAPTDVSDYETEKEYTVKVVFKFHQNADGE